MNREPRNVLENNVMQIERVTGMYFSATGTTEKIVKEIAGKLAELLTPGRDAEYIDFTLPYSREEYSRFDETDLIVFGTPTYAGRVPNVLLPYIREKVRGGGNLCIPVVLFGNRDYDDSLIELCSILKDDGMIPAAAGAFVGEHSFSYELAAGRPDEHDLSIASDFAARAAEKIRDAESIGAEELSVRGETPPRPYYTPRDRNGNGIDIRKVKPVTGPACDRCGTCVRVCPMGSIDPEEPSVLTGICIKCGACVKKCPLKCKYFDDENYLYHKSELEEMYARRAEPETFI